MAAQGDLIRTLGRHKVEAWTVAVRPDGSYIASGSADNTIKLWSREGQLLHTRQVGQSSTTFPHFPHFSPDGTRLL